MKMMTIRMTEELHKKLKLLCVSLGIGMGTLIIELIEKEVKKEAQDV